MPDPRSAKDEWGSPYYVDRHLTGRLVADEALGVKLPDGFRATVLAGTDGQGPLEIPVVWAERLYTLCPFCDEPLPPEDGCPVAIDPAGDGGSVIDIQRLHPCGQEIEVEWEVPAEKVDDPREWIERVALKLAVEQWTELLRSAVLLAFLGMATRKRFGETLAEREAELTTGSETEPGVYQCPKDGWVAWGYVPGGEDSGAVMRFTLKDVLGSGDEPPPD
ncbi:hypothetical protein AB0L06_24990 [Spirillospora sp. NPDC052269]